LPALRAGTDPPRPRPPAGDERVTILPPRFKRN